MAVDVPPADVVEAVERELEAKGRRYTSTGMAALILAARLRDAEHEPGTAAAGLAKQLDATMAIALAGEAEEEVDELEALRRKRSG